MRILRTFDDLSVAQRAMALASFIGADSQDDHLYELDNDGQVLSRRKKPDFCFVFLETNGPGKYVGMVKKDETGYYPTTYDFEDKDMARKTVDFINLEKLGLQEEEVVWLIAQSMRRSS